MKRTSCPNDDEWSYKALFVTLMTEEAPQREHDVREVFNGLRWIVRIGAQWKMMSHDLPRGQQYISRRSSGSKREYFAEYQDHH